MRFFLFTTLLWWSYIQYPQTFVLPVQTSDPVITSGFGEYRKTHYHYGWDFRTRNLSSKQIRSIADGYVARIRCLSSSYGKVVEVKHPYGYTSLYAHLDSFVQKLDSIVRSYQYQKQQYDVVIELDSGIFPVKRGQILGTAGNSGYSFGEHLHFEIRDKNNTLQNPGLFLKIKDELYPEIKTIYFYRMWTGLPIYPLESVSFSVKSPYLDISLPSGEYMLGVEAYDQQLHGGPILPLYGWNVNVNDSLFFQMNFSSLSIEEKNYVHILFDPIAQSGKKRIYLSHPLVREMKFLNYFISEKPFIAKPSSKYEIRFEVYDHQKNKTSRKVIVTTTETKPVSFKDLIHRNQDLTFQTTKASLFIPSGAFPGWVKSERLWFKHIKDLTFEAGVSSIPLLKPCTIAFHNMVSDGKELLVMFGEKNDTLDVIKPMNVKNDTLFFEVSRFAKYELIRDSIPPHIVSEPVLDRDSWKKSKKICWVIKDHSKMISSYDVFVDDSWQILEYDKKNDTFCLETGNWLKNAKTIKIKICDAAGNCVEKTYFL